MLEVHGSPFGVIPKSEPGKWRLIVNLSAPECGSVNDEISREMCSLSYDEVLQLGRGALLAKFDLRAAYRNVLVHPDDRHLLGQYVAAGQWLRGTCSRAIALVRLP